MKAEGVFSTKYISQLSHSPQDSDLESDAEFSDTENADSGDSCSSTMQDNVQAIGWMSWCSLI